MLRDIGYVEGSIGCVPSGIWPNGLRYLWTDAFEVVLYLALYSDAAWTRARQGRRARHLSVWIVGRCCATSATSKARLDACRAGFGQTDCVISGLTPSKSYFT